MKKTNLTQKEFSLKLVAAIVSAMIVMSSVSMIGVIIRTPPEDEGEFDYLSQSYQTRPCKVSTVLAQEGNWVSLDGNTTPPGTPAEVHILVSDTSGITLVADFYGYWRRNSGIDNTTVYDELIMPGTTSIKDPGKPSLPCLAEFVELPHDVDATFKVLSISSADLSNYNVTPAQPPESPISYEHLNITISPQPTFFDEEYTFNYLYPDNVVSLGGGTNSSALYMRGHRITELSIYPIQFNPVLEKLTVYSQIVFKIQYSNPAQIEPIEASKFNPVIEKILEGYILNYEPFEPILGTPTIFGPISSLERGAEYLIITNATFEREAYRLADWKRQKGLLTEVEVIPNGASRDDIKQFIQNAYKNWNPAPAYVLIFGDAEFIPTNYDLVHTGDYEGFDLYDDQGFIASDLGYFTIEGTDYFPEMIYGRISVDTITEAWNFVNKILAYEQVAFSIDDDYYSSILSAAFFQDKDNFGYYDGQEQFGYQYVEYAERIRDHLISQEYDYNVIMNYSAYVRDTRPRPDSIWNGDPLGSHLLDPNFIWINASSLHLDEAADNITANFNDGRFLVYHLDHGGSYNMVYLNGDTDQREGWMQPCFNVTDIASLSNVNWTPLVISISCHTGWFDGETDQSAMGSMFAAKSYECMAEMLTRYLWGGAVAMIASSRASYNIPGGDMLNGIMQAFFPGLLPYGNQPIYEMGAALLAGKMNVVKLWRTDTSHYKYANSTCQMYHLFGDPETQLWTDSPSLFSAEFPKNISTNGAQEFVVTVFGDSGTEPYAKVCIQKGNDEYQVGYTDPLGQVRFHVNLDSPGPMNLTITKHNFKPFIREINCVDSTTTLTIAPVEGEAALPIVYEISGFDAAEDVKIFWDTTHVFTIPAGSTTANHIVPIGHFKYTNVIAYGTESGYVATTLFNRHNLLEGPDPYIYSQWDASTWGSTGWTRSWDNPDITVFLGLHTLSRRHIYQSYTYTVRVAVHNKGIVDADGTKVTLWSAPIGVGLTWTFIGEREIDVPAGETRMASIPWMPLVPGRACLRVIIYHPYDENELNNKGYENVQIISLASPGETGFLIGNPTETNDYVSIRVRQLDKLPDIWNATIMDYSLQPIESSDNESISLIVDPKRQLEFEEERGFIAEIYINNEFIDGVVFNVTNKKDEFWSIVGFTGYIVSVIIVALVIVKLKYRK